MLALVLRHLELNHDAVRDAVSETRVIHILDTHLHV